LFLEICWRQEGMDTEPNLAINKCIVIISSAEGRIINIDPKYIYWKNTRVLIFYPLGEQGGCGWASGWVSGWVSVGE